MNAPLPDWWVKATPDGKRAANPGKHEIYVYGQQSADGQACIGCSWQTSDAYGTPAAIAKHDQDMGLEHDHELWVPLERGPMAGTCPCGKPDLYEDSALRHRIQATLHDVLPWGLTPEQLTEILVGAIVPASGIVVSFTAEQQTESDWELDYSASYTDLVAPEVLAHRLSERELAELYFQIEAVGTLGESNAFGDLDKQIEHLGQEPAERLRTQNPQPVLDLFVPDTNATDDTKG